jgi:hypothetical protein
MDEVQSFNELSMLEARYWDEIRGKDAALRAFLSGSSLVDSRNPTAWFSYLTNIRDIVGNSSNSLSFVATLLVKDYLVERFMISGFDAALKPQGAPGIDIEVRTPGGLHIIAEIKTTKPYQPGFGAAQKAAIQKDLDRLAREPADHRIMFVTDADAFSTLCGSRYRERYPAVEIVNAVTRTSSANIE